jgi:AbiV family abortive infection protein
MMNLKKLEKIELLAFKNCLRLHADSITLFKNKSYPSAYFLSVLSLEELGKACSLQDFIWHSRTEGRILEEEEKDWLGLLYNHVYKQAEFFRFLKFTGSKKSLKEMADIDSGVLEFLKQKAVYVGLKRLGRAIDYKGKIISPFKVSREDANKQISLINDALVELIIGVICDYSSWDTEETERLITKRLLKKIITNWKVTPKIKKLIENRFKESKIIF